MRKVISETQNRSSVFSNLAFAFGILTLVIVIGIFVFLVSASSLDKAASVIPEPIYSLLRLSCFSGFLFTVISFIVKEKISYFKLTGAILNIIFFALLIIVSIIALFTLTLP